MWKRRTFLLKEMCGNSAYVSGSAKGGKGEKRRNRLKKENYPQMHRSYTHKCTQLTEFSAEGKIFFAEKVGFRANV